MSKDVSMKKVLIVITFLSMTNFSHVVGASVTLPDSALTLAKNERGKIEKNSLTNEVLRWSEQNVVQLFTFDYKNYAPVFESRRRLFTENGFRSFEKLWRESRNLEAMRVNKLAVSANLLNQANVVKEGEEERFFFFRRYEWMINVPVQIRYWNAEQEMKMNSLVEIKVIRTKNKARDHVFLIDNIDMKDATPGLLEIRITPQGKAE